MIYSVEIIWFMSQSTVLEGRDIERELYSWAISLFLSLEIFNVFELFEDLLIYQLGGFFVSRNRKHGIFGVSSDVVVISKKQKVLRENDKEIREALENVFNQMRIAGNRQRTIDGYKYIFNQFVEVCHIEYVEDINIDNMYHYLDILEVKSSTKLIRLKSIKAVLSKFFNNGWIKDRFWSNIQIKIDKEVKKGAKESDIDKLLQMIDQTTFIGFRDACAVKLMYKTGIVFAH